MPETVGSPQDLPAVENEGASLSPDPSPSNPPFRFPSQPEFDLSRCMSNAAVLVERVLIRQLQEDISQEANVQLLPPEEAADDTILDVFERLVNNFKTGQSTSALKNDIMRLLSNQEEKADIVNNLLVMHDVDRLPKFLRIRLFVENYLVKSAHRHDLTPAEALAFLKISQGEIDAITQRVRGGTTPLKDVEALIDRADFVSQMNEQELIKKFSMASPQGLEILRKVGYRLSKLAAQDA